MKKLRSLVLRWKKNFFFIYDVITWEKLKKGSANNYSRQRHKWRSAGGWSGDDVILDTHIPCLSRCVHTLEYCR